MCLLNLVHLIFLMSAYRFLYLLIIFSTLDWLQNGMLNKFKMSVTSKWKLRWIAEASPERTLLDNAILAGRQPWPVLSPCRTRSGRKISNDRSKTECTKKAGTAGTRSARHYSIIRRKSKPRIGPRECSYLYKTRSRHNSNFLLLHEARWGTRACVNACVHAWPFAGPCDHRETWK